MIVFIRLVVLFTFALLVAVLVVVLRILHEIQTLRDQATIGMLASESEIRRVENLNREDRTIREQRHLDATALEEAPQPEE